MFQKSWGKTIVSYWTNGFRKKNFLKTINFENKYLKKNANGFLLNERFYWKIVEWEKERNIWKMNGNFKEERNKFSLKNWSEWVVHERWTKEIKKMNVPISTGRFTIFYPDIYIYIYIYILKISLGHFLLFI